jgi:hypothetical protein
MNVAGTTYHCIGTLNARRLLATRLTQPGGQLQEATSSYLSRA